MRDITLPTHAGERQPTGLAQRFTRISKAGAGMLVTLYLLCLAFPSLRANLSLVPAKVIPCVWMLFTSSFVEQSWVPLVANALSLLFMSKPIEQVWGSREYAKYISICAVSSATITWICLLVEAMIFTAVRETDLLYVPYGGFLGVVGGLMVGLKQVMPDTTVTIAGLLKVGVSSVPFASVVFLAAFTFLLRLPLYPMYLLLSGIYAGWLYLRFFQPVPGTALRGDERSEFRFATLFPSPLHGPCDSVLKHLEPIAAAIRTRPQSQEALPLIRPPASTQPDSNAQRHVQRGQSALAAHLMSKQKQAERASTPGRSQGGPSAGSEQGGGKESGTLAGSAEGGKAPSAQGGAPART